MLFSGFVDLLDVLTVPHHERRTWAIWALPLHLYERLGTGAQLCEVGYVRAQLERAGVRRDIANVWPQRIGYSVALKLSERGRVAFALVSQGRDVFRATRRRPSEFKEHTVRVEAPELLVALRAAGTRPPKTPRSVAVTEDEGQR